MAEILEMEARLKNFISQNLTKIRDDLKNMERTAKKSFASVDSGADKVINTLKKFVGAAAAIALARKAWMALNQLAKESVELFKIQEQAVQRLRVSVGDTTDSLVKYAGELQKVTTYGDEEIVAAQALIANFIKEEDQIKKLIPAVLDFAAAKQFKLTAAADLVTKTIASETNALTRYGLEVEGAAGSSERLESAVNALNTAFGGTATAIAELDTGQLDQINNRIGDIKEGIGQDVIPLYQEWAKLNEQILTGISAIVKVIAASPADIALEKIRAAASPLTEVEMQMLKVEKQINDLRSGKGSDVQQQNAERFLTIHEETLKVLEAERLSILKGEVAGPQVGEPKKAGKWVDLRPTDEQKKAGEKAAEESKKAAEKAAEELKRVEDKFFTDSVAAYLDFNKKRAEDQATANQQQLDAEKVLRDASIRLIGDDGERELAMFDAQTSDLIDGIIGSEDTITAIKLAAEKERKELSDEMVEAKKQKDIQSAIDAAEQIASSAIGLNNQLINLSRQARQQELSNEKARIGGLKIGQKEKDKLIKKAEAENKKAANKEKALSLTSAVVSTALAIAKANSATPYPPVNAVLMALAGAAGAVQIATIASQKFAGGGIVGGNSPIGDRNMIAANTNEVVLNPRQQAELLFNIANGGGGGGGSNLNVSFNVASGANLDNDAADKIVNSVTGLAKALENAERAGALGDFKQMIGVS